MYISIALELPRLVSDEWRQVVTWALSVGAERRLQCGDVEYRAPSATKPDVRFMCLPDVGTTLAVGCVCFVVPTHMCCVRRFGPSFRADADESPLENSDDP